MQQVTRFRRLGPFLCRTLAMHGEIQRQRSCGGVEGARGIVAHLGLVAIALKEQLYVVVGAKADKIAQIVALQRDADHVGGDAARIGDGQHAALQFVPVAGDDLVHMASFCPSATGWVRGQMVPSYLAIWGRC